MCPPSRKMVRLLTSRAKRISWVTTIMVMPLSARFFITSSTSPIISGSRALVGSSKSITSGSIISERTMAMRCFCPPESWLGYASARSASPTRPRSSRALASASARSMPLMRMGPAVRFFITFILLNRLNCWNTMPIFCRCWSICLLCPLAQMSTPSIRICPEVGFSSRFRQRRKVLLPPPEGPMMDTTSFFLNVTLMFLRTSSL